MIENFIPDIFRSGTKKRAKRAKREEKKRIEELKEKFLPISIVLIILSLFTSYKIANFLSNKKFFIGAITLIFFFYNNFINRKSLIGNEKILPPFILSGYLTFLLHYKPEQKMKLLKIIIGFVAMDIYIEY